MAQPHRKQHRKNHLREVLDAASAPGQLRIAPGIGAQRAQEIVRDLQGHGEHAMCFYAGDAYKQLDQQAVPELCRLPFDVCWIEFDMPEAGANDVLGLLIVQSHTLYGVYSLMRVSGGWWLTMGAQVDQLFAPSVAGTAPEGPEGDSALAIALEAACAFLSALNCSNVHRAEIPPNDRLQKARAKRGKKPLFSYWVLQLKASNGHQNHLGGTHAAPRLHLRRGHPRQYAPGQWTWVQPHAVGSKPAGMVHKDYDSSRLEAAR